MGNFRPVFETDEITVKCGYGPRSLQQSRDGKSVFVGCKDGSVTIVRNALDAHQWDRLEIDPRRGLVQVSGIGENREQLAAVRALCELETGALLIGRQDGTIDLADWRRQLDPPREAAYRVIHPKTIFGGGDRLTHLSWLDDRHLVVSARRSRLATEKSTEVFRWDDKPTPEAILDRLGGPTKQPIETALAEQALACAGAVGKHSWLFVGEDTRLWRAKVPGVEPPSEELQAVQWSGGDQPGLILNQAAIKPPHGSEEPAKGFYLPTDLGVFVLDEFSEKAVPVPLPGLDHLCLAMTHFDDQELGQELLWAVDALGYAHLFARAPRPGPAGWKRSALRREATETLLTLALASKQQDGIVVAQARRDDRLMLSRFRHLDDQVRYVRRATGPTATSRAEGDQPASVPKSGAAPTEDAIDPRWLLFRGTAEALATDSAWLGDEGPTAAKPEQQLVRLVERLAYGTADQKHILEDFLSAPTSVLARNVLAEIDQSDRAPALQRWSDALIGIVHRFFSSRRRELCLGVVRWLELVRDEAPQYAELVPTVIEAARRWGVFGGVSYAGRSLWQTRQTLRAQLRASSSRSASADNLSLLVYDTRLYDRGYDVECETEGGALFLSAPSRVRIDRFPDFATIDGGSSDLFAVRWTEERLDFYLLRSNRGERNSGPVDITSRLVKLELTSGPLEGPIGAVAFAKDARQPGVCHLVVGLQKNLVLYRVIHEPKTGKARLDPVGRPKPLSELLAPERRSKAAGHATEQAATCLLDLEQGLMLLGLSGSHREPSLRLLTIRGEEPSQWVASSGQLDMTTDVPASRLHVPNPVQCLAAMSVTATGDAEGGGRAWQVAAGCPDGRLFLLRLEQHADGTLDAPVQLREQLGAPVTYVKVRGVVQPPGPVGGAEGRPEVAIRCFAGTSDGTLMAWQELPATENGRQATGAEKRFAELWATSDAGGEITSLDILDPPFDYPDAPKLPELVAATSAQGRVILRGNNERIALATSDPAPLGSVAARVHGPGTRYLPPIELKQRPLAACWLPLPATQQTDTEDEDDIAARPVVQLLVASAAGTLQVVTLHLLRHSRARSRALAQLEKRWRGLTLPHGTVLPQRSFEGERLVGACPAYPLFLLRWLLRPPGVTRYEFLPFLFRRLPALAAQLRGPQEIQSGNLTDDLLSEPMRAMRKADIPLFQELLSELARKFNDGLMAALDPDRSESLELRGIRENLQRLLRCANAAMDDGSPPLAPEVRVHFLKMLLKDAIISRLGVLAQDNGEAEKILDALWGEVHNLMLKGDLTLCLEALRAVNLALAGCCVRFEAKRRNGWKPEDPEHEQELPWDVTRKLIDVLRDFTNTVGHRKAGFHDALLQEIARCYALAVSACPSAAIPIAYSVSDTGPTPADLPRRIAAQAQLLNALAIGTPEHARRLAGLACQDLDGLWKAAEEACGDVRLPQPARPGVIAAAQTAAREEFLEKAGLKVGSGNAEGIADAALLYWVVDAIRQLTRWMQRRPERIDLDDLHARLEAVQAAAKDKTWNWRHSGDFWSKALTALQEIKSLKLKSAHRITPGWILGSRGLRDWARRCSVGKRTSEGIDGVETRRAAGQLFEPQATFYNGALKALEKAADGFPESAAVQASLMEAILSHGLIADLDEHVMVLEEIGDALDPLLSEEYRKHDRDPQMLPGRAGSTAARFAGYLMRRARSAEAIPQTLRTLQGVLRASLDDPRHLLPVEESSADPRHRRASGERELLTMIEDLAGKSWKTPNPSPAADATALSAAQKALLKLALDELYNNDQVHGGRDDRRNKGRKNPTTVAWKDGLEFTFPCRDEALVRFAGLLDWDLDDPPAEPRRVDLPVEPWPDRRIPSHGTGLYLATLAAAIAGWDLLTTMLRPKRRGRSATITMRLLARVES